MRISKFLSSKNIGSRKDIEKLIMEKRISLNGVIITTPITFVDETDLIYLDNKLINSMSFRQLQMIRSQIGMVFQFGALFDSLNVAENIGLALRKLTKLTDYEIESRIKNSLESVDMSNTEELMPGELSGGMKKRIGIARAIAIQPSYLFYDEPTTGLDPVMTDSINRLILKIQENQQITSVIITHELRTVYEVADRVIMLHDGSIQFDGKPNDLEKTENKIVKQFITGDSTLV